MKYRKRIGLFFLNIFFILICLLCLIPVLYALGISLNGHNDLLSSNFSLIPQNVTFDNYRCVLFEKPFFLWFKNSLILSAFTVLISILVAVPGACALSRKRFRGRKMILNLLILLNAFPAILSMFAVYRILKPMGLINSFTGLILIYIGTMAIFGLWNVLPLARPSIIVTAVMILIYVWNEYIFAVTFITSSGKYTLAAGLYALQATDYTRNWPVGDIMSTQGSAGTKVYIYGRNFGTSPTVKFGNTAATVLSSTSTMIETTVPSGAVHGDNSVTVTNSGMTSNGIVYNVLSGDQNQVIFHVKASTNYGDNIYVVGSIPELGSWDTSKCTEAMLCPNYPEWYLPVSVPANTTFQFKFIKKNANGNVTWESSSNRTVTSADDKHGLLLHPVKDQIIPTNLKAIVGFDIQYGGQVWATFRKVCQPAHGFQNARNQLLGSDRHVQMGSDILLGNL
ncbi:hypothetical protein A7X67_00050 [Clostridium sp. W14A]|nr:hypothetical protein A7X67_00050 [Clostridium sp. W14A]